MALTLNDYYFGYTEIILVFSLFGFIFDSWFIGQIFMLIITINLLIINDFVTVFKEGIGFVFLLGYMTYYIINLTKWVIEHYILKHPLFSWVSDEDDYTDIFKKLSNDGNGIKILIHYTLNIIVLIIPVAVFYFVKFAGYQFGFVPLEVVLIWITGIIVIPLYVVYTYAIGPFYFSKLASADMKKDGKGYKAEMKVKYIVVTILGGLQLFMAYFIFPICYMFEVNNVFLHSLANWWGILWLYVIGTILLIGGPIIIAFIVMGYYTVNSKSGEKYKEVNEVNEVNDEMNE